MKQQLKKLTAFVSAAAVVTVGGILCLSFPAKGDGIKTVLDISRGSIVINNDTVSGKNSAGEDVTATDPDGYIITGTTEEYTVTVSGDQKITLKDATIDLTSRNYFCAFDIGNGGNVTLTLEGVNTIKSGKSCAGIDVIEGERLEITGTGSLTVTGGQYGAGIGTGETNNGAFSCGSVVISGGSVLATGGYLGANVGDGAWYFSSEGGDPYYTNGDFYPPKDKDDNSLYHCRIDNPNSDTVLIDGVEFLPKIHSNSELAVHAYLTEDTHYINVGDKLYATAPHYIENTSTLDYLTVTQIGTAFSISATNSEEALVYGEDYTYPADTGVLNILSNKAVTISGTTTTDTIVVGNNVSANITLDGVNIDVSELSKAAFNIFSGGNGNVKVKLADGSENILKSGSGYAGLQKNGDTGTLEITGTTGKLTAEGSTGIGSNSSSPAYNITISGGIITATGTNGAGIGGGSTAGAADNIKISGGVVVATSTNGAGIGGGKATTGITAGLVGNGTNITITGGSVTAISESGAGIGGGWGSNGSNIYIRGGSVKAESTSGNAIGGGEGKDPVTPTDGNGNNVYLLTIANPNSEDVYVDGNAYLPKVHSDDNKNIYAYLTGEPHTVKVGEKTKEYYFDSTNSKFFEAGLKVSGENLVYGTDYTYESGVLSILSGNTITISNIDKTTPTTDTIFVAYGVSADIILDGVNIDVSGTPDTCAFKIADNSVGNVTITLADNSENTLISGSGCAGLQKNGAYISADKGKLTITGNTGTLTAIGGSRGAGIGGGYNASGSNIIISGGSVTAQSSGNGAGIGGGYEGSAENIIISGGTVTATGGDMGAGIGGNNRSGSNIIISGGTVIANGGNGGAGIGGGTGGSGSDITISGGSVTAKSNGGGAGIGGGESGKGSNITISGGTVTATGGWDAAGIGSGNGVNEYNVSGSNITISGGTVTATGGDRGAGIGGGNDASGSNIIISGGSVKAVAGSEANAIGGGKDGNGAVTPTNGTNEVYLLTIANPGGESVYIDGELYPLTAHSAEDKNIYAYLTGETHIIKVGEETNLLKFDSASKKFAAADLTITGEGIVYGTDYTFANDTFTILSPKAITISGSTTSENVFVAKDVSANITLDGVNIDVSSLNDTAAFKIEDDSEGNVTITLADGSENKLISGTNCAGLQKDGAYTATLGKLTIKGGANGTGKLTATCGVGGWGAGIGGGAGGSGSNITITGGVVTATGGIAGAGIGGGPDRSGSNITISGGTVTATGGNGGAGIGGGCNSSGSDIRITGGTVTATGGDYGAGIGGGDKGSGSDITISGGSVKAVAGSEANVIGGGKDGNGAVTPTNGTNEVYLLEIANDSGEAITIDGKTYPTSHNGEKKIYAYLTGEAHTVTIGEVTTEYKFYDGIFLPVPTASDFTFTAPENLKYTGTAKTATVTSDKTGMGEITPKYFNANGVEVTRGTDFVPGTYTVKIDVAKGDNYAEATDITDAGWKFTITAGDLTASGTGKASGTFGDKLSELTVSGLTAKLGDTEIEGTWALSGNTIPNVGDTTKYTAAFTPSENADWYNELTDEVSLDIAKADAPEMEDIELSYNWAATGEKTATVSGLPDNMGTLGTATAEISDENGIIADDSAAYSAGKITFTLNGFDSEKMDISAVIKVTLPTQNYKDITFSVIVSITAKLDKDAPAESEFELNVDLLSDNTYTATITTALTGVEFSFDGVNWSGTNTKAVGHAETVTGYIRYAETDDYNASPYSSKTETTSHGTLTHHAAKAATCTEDGNIEYWTCDSCKLYFSDENGTTEITQAQTVITKLGHKWAEKYNFDKDGHWHKCEVCGDTSEIEPHVSDSAATADSAEICNVCGYEIAPKLGQVAAPQFTPNGGTFTEVQTVTITSATEGAEIYYTTDGKDPTTSSTKYTAAITIGKTTTIKAVAVKDGMTDSTVVTAEFTINLPVKETVATPVISPNGGTFSGSQKVTITCDTEGAKIYYTTDGSAPTTSSKLYEEAFTISATTTVKAIAVKDGMVDSEIATATFTKKSSGGGGYRPTTPTEPNNPSIGGSAKSWSDVAADLATLPISSEVTIELNGNTTVPAEVIKVIDERDIKVSFVVDSAKSWKTDGAEITTPAAADLSILTTSKLKTDTLRGISGLQFTMNNTNIPTDLSVAFKAAHAGKFANLYKSVDGTLVFVTCAKLGEDGKVILPDVVDKGEYVVMLCEFSDRLGDMDNDGIMNAKDAAAILKDIVEIEPGKNPLMADFNGDGKVNAMDAAAILKRIVGLA